MGRISKHNHLHICGYFHRLGCQYSCCLCTFQKRLVGSKDTDGAVCFHDVLFRRIDSYFPDGTGSWSIQFFLGNGTSFSVSTYNIIVARTFFQNSLPGELWDAAQVDGCGNLRFFFTMALPLSKAVISVIALWTAVGQWNSYFNALIYIRDTKLYPLQLIMRNILITNQSFAALGTGEAAIIAMRKASLVRYSMIIVSTVPIMCVYPFIQKHFDQGVMIGSVKG